MRHFGDIMFTDNVKAEQTRRGSRDAYAKMTARPAPEGLGEREAAFIAARDSFYMASVTKTGWPYVQHRGGPRGFLKVIDAATLGMADYRGNKQYVSTGNLKHDDRVSLFLMDYPNRARLKILAHASIEEAADNPELAARLSVAGEGRVERLFLFHVTAFDWNCPQFITPRFTDEELQAALAPEREAFAKLRAENADLKKQLAAQPR
ncbi:MAG: pyridoxamine 5'-phosphate oxidase family protein [Pseudomonadota bacterium]